LLPTIGLNGSDTRSRVESQPDIANADRNFTTFSNTWSLALSQPLFRWANWQQYEQGKLSVVISEAQFAQAKQDLIVRVGQAYFDARRARYAGNIAGAKSGDLRTTGISETQL
jgi:outer membrane protein